MSRKDFIAIAAVIADSRDDFKSPTAHARFSARVASMLAETNPRFDRARFVTACTPRWYVGTRHANAFQREASR